MRITKYNTELDSDNKNILVKEKAFNYPMQSLSTPYEIYRCMTELFNLQNKAEEYLYMIAFNTKQKVLGVFEIAHGTVNACLCSPREIFIRAVLCGATGIILCHNHPSGDSQPSIEDKNSYERVKKAGQIINIEVLDSIVIGNAGYISLREN